VSAGRTSKIVCAMPGATIENLGGSALTGLIQALLTAKSTGKTQKTRVERYFMEFIFPICTVRLQNSQRHPVCVSSSANGGGRATLTQSTQAGAATATAPRNAAPKTPQRPWRRLSQ
jgi:hypothetical protein